MAWDEKHKELARECFEELSASFLQDLDGEAPLPGTISFPHESKIDGVWVRLSLTISPLKTIKDPYG